MRPPATTIDNPAREGGLALVRNRGAPFLMAKT
jgi:hypothetical protein